MNTLNVTKTRKSQFENVQLEDAVSRFNKEHYVSIVPTSKFYYSFRNLGYNNYEALADIIDNSLDPDVSSKNVWVEISKDMSTITISDDGSGMNLSETRIGETSTSLVAAPSRCDVRSFCIG